ncbi:MAG: ArsR/SmtB family transcription factor [Ktedonobacterales bacterium]
MAKTSIQQSAAEIADACCSPHTSPESLAPGDSGALAERLKVLADVTRLRMLALLVENPEPLCVCEFTALLPQRQPTISHHLRLLREARLVNSEKRGVWSYFWATDEGRRSLALVQMLM